MIHFPVVNDAYDAEFDNPYSHKRVPRFTSLDAAREYLPVMWVAANEAGEIVGAVCAKVVLCSRLASNY